MNEGDSIPTETLAETENYSVWISEEPDGEITYHVEVGAATMQATSPPKCQTASQSV